MKNRKKDAGAEVKDSLVPQLEAEELALEEMLKTARSDADAAIAKAEKDAAARKETAATQLEAELRSLRSAREAAIRASIEEKIKNQAKTLEEFSNTSQEKKKDAVQFILKRVLQEQST